MKTKILFILFIVSTPVILSSCLKKGEGDPLVSFQSRKARIAGEWKAISYLYKSTELDSSGTHIIYEFMAKESTYSVRIGFPNPYATGNGTFKMRWSFTRDGHFTSTVKVDGNDFVSDGLWNFLGGVGEFKNKEQVALLEENYTSSTGVVTSTGNFIKDAYDIVELKNKEMHWHSVVKRTYPTGQVRSIEDEYDIVFVPVEKK